MTSCVPLVGTENISNCKCIHCTGSSIGWLLYRLSYVPLRASHNHHVVYCGCVHLGVALCLLQGRSISPSGGHDTQPSCWYPTSHPSHHNNQRHTDMQLDHRSTSVSACLRLYAVLAVASRGCAHPGHFPLVRVR